MLKTLLSMGNASSVGLAAATAFARRGYRIVLALDTPRSLSFYYDFISRNAAGANILQTCIDTTNPRRAAELVRCLGDEIDVLHYSADIDATSGKVGKIFPTVGNAPRVYSNDGGPSIDGAVAAMCAAIPSMRRCRDRSIFLTGSVEIVAAWRERISANIHRFSLKAVGDELFAPVEKSGLRIDAIAGYDRYGARMHAQDVVQSLIQRMTVDAHFWPSMR